jgi:hypothetical protein
MVLAEHGQMRERFKLTTAQKCIINNQQWTKQGSPHYKNSAPSTNEVKYGLL